MTKVNFKIDAASRQVQPHLESSVSLNKLKTRYVYTTISQGCENDFEAPEMKGELHLLQQFDSGP